MSVHGKLFTLFSVIFEAEVLICVFGVHMMCVSQVELIARKVLTDPVEILVGGRSVVNSDITQFVEIRPESERFFRLLELLGVWYEKGKVSTCVLFVTIHSVPRLGLLFFEAHVLERYSSAFLKGLGRTLQS